MQPDPMSEELKHYESDLSGLASLIQALLNNTGAGIYIVQDKKFVYINPYFEELSGYTMEELAGKPSLDLVHPDDKKLVRQKVVDILKNRAADNTYEYRFLKKNGEVVWVLERITSMEYMGARAAMGSFMDINQRKVLEEALATSEEWHRAILSQMQDACYEVDLEGKYLFVNDSMCRGLWYTQDEIMGQSSDMIVPESDRQLCSDQFRKVFETGKPNTGFAHRVRRKDGAVGYAETSISLLRNPQGEPYAFLCVGRDITQRKMLEAALAASEERYRTIIEQMHDGCYGLDLEGNFIFVNQGVCRDTGYLADELIGKRGIMVVPEEIRKTRNQVYAEVLKTGEPKTSLVSQVRRKDGSIIFTESSISLLRNAAGDPTGFLCVSRDITQRKALEEALAASEEKYRSILERMLDSYYEVDLAGNFTFLNDSTIQNLGYDKGELEGKNFKMIMPDDEAERVFPAFHQVYETGQPNLGFSHRIIRKDGSIGYAESSIMLLRDKQGRPIGFSALGRDVTERKLLEEELKNSEERYRTTLEQMQDGYYELDLHGNYTYANNAAEKILGVTRENLIGQSYRLVVPAEEVEPLYHVYNEVYKSGIPNKGFAHKMVRKDGSIIYLDTSVDLRRNEKGEVIGFKSVGRDVTGRRQLELELQLSEEKYRSILEEMEDAYYEVDLSGNFLFVNEATSRHTGYSREELTTMNFRQITFEEDINPVFTAFNNVYRSGEPNKGYSHRMIKKDGNIGYVEAAVSMLKDKQGKIIGFRAVSRDVTERKKLEQKLADMATHDFLTGLPNRILLIDRFQVAVAQAARNNYKLAVMSLDLDRFKEVNDTLGHAAGDELLKAISGRLLNVLRSSDTVARVGGDEFLLLLQEIHYPEDATLIAEKILESCKEPLHVAGNELFISSSIGIALFPDNGETLDMLMRKSDAAMYYSKRNGGSQFKIFNGSDQLELSH